MNEERFILLINNDKKRFFVKIIYDNNLQNFSKGSVSRRATESGHTEMEIVFRIIPGVVEDSGEGAVRATMLTGVVLAHSEKSLGKISGQD